VPGQSNWAAEHKVASTVLGVGALLLVLIVIGAASGGSKKSTDQATTKNASATTNVKQSHAQTATKPVHKKVQVHHTKQANTGKAASATTTTASSGGQDSWVMPDLRGTDLQTAQDAIQSLTDDGIWYTDSHDATGQDRGQWFDRDWQVCNQNVAPGTRITADSDIDFGVVRRDVESCS
jgi:hypothetical protein